MKNNLFTNDELDILIKLAKELNIPITSKKNDQGFSQFIIHKRQSAHLLPSKEKTEKFWDDLKNDKTDYSQVIDFSTDQVVDPSVNKNGTQNLIQPIKTDDGGEIAYHLHVPKTFFESKKPLPVVFHVYGGGSPIDFTKKEIFDFNRVLAHLGCVVVAIKGEEMPKQDNDPTKRINYQNFPQRVFQDIECVVNFLKRSDAINGQAIIRPKAKIFLSGGSFGGYVTAIMSTTPIYNKLFDGYMSNNSVWDCAKTTRESCIYKYLSQDLSKYDWQRRKEQDTKQFCYYFKNNYLENNDYNIKISPFYHLNKLERPMLVIQGILDSTVSPKEAQYLISNSIEVGKDSLMRFYFMDQFGHNVPQRSAFKEFKKLYETYINFIANVIDGNTHTHHQKIPLLTSGMDELSKEKSKDLDEEKKLFNKNIDQFNDKKNTENREILNCFAKKFKEKRVDRLIQGTHPFLQTRKGVFHHLLYNAWLTKGGATEKDILYQLLINRYLDEEGAKDLFKQFMNMLPEITKFNLLNDPRLGEEMRDEIEKKMIENQENEIINFNNLKRKNLPNSKLNEINKIAKTHLKGLINDLKELEPESLENVDNLKELEPESLKNVDTKLDNDLVLFIKNLYRTNIPIDLHVIKTDILTRFNQDYEPRFDDYWSEYEKTIEDFKKNKKIK